MKKILFSLMPLLLLVPVVHAGLDRSSLPESSYYSGQHDRSFDLGSGNILDIHLEFAVYKDNEAQIMQDWTGHTGDAAFVYAYQVFCDSSNDAGLTYFALTGVNPSTIADVQKDIGENESLNSGAIQSGGVAPTSGDFNASVTKAIWQFDEGTLVQGEQSWFLFLYSNYDWIKGDIQIQPLSNDDIPIPGVPEPATLVLLGCGAVLSLIRRK